MANPNTSSFWDKKIDDVREIPDNDFITKDRIEFVASLVPNRSINLLDIGFGYGFLEHRLSRKDRIHIYGVDISTTAVERATVEFGRRFINASVLELPFKSETFDFACLLEVLEHLSDSEALIVYTETLRVLRKRAKLVVSVPLYDKIFAGHPSGHLRMYEPQLLISELESLNLKIIRKKFLYAFKTYYRIKTLANKLLRLKNPNNMVVLVEKQ